MSVPIAITMGEPSGIGPELTLAAWKERKNLPRFVAIDDPAHLKLCAQRLGFVVPVVEISDLKDLEALSEDVLPVLPCEPLASFPVPGQPVAANSGSVINSVKKAVLLTLQGKFMGIVTNPVCKSVLASAGFVHRGHTEYLGFLVREAGLLAQPVMMLVTEAIDPPLRVVPVTVHISLKDVAKAFTTEAIVEVGRVVAEDLRVRFGILSPRLAVAGINPHAGEEGQFGDEETKIIKPAITALMDEGIIASGPWPADTLFHNTARRLYDAVLCAYHDQALIPLKTLDFAGGVNVTLGLPFVRTSPDHGTAFNIAGRGIADPASLFAALHITAKLAG